MVRHRARPPAPADAGRWRRGRDGEGPAAAHAPPRARRNVLEPVDPAGPLGPWEGAPRQAGSDRTAMWWTRQGGARRRTAVRRRAAPGGHRTGPGAGVRVRECENPVTRPVLPSSTRTARSSSSATTMRRSGSTGPCPAAGWSPGVPARGRPARAARGDRVDRSGAGCAAVHVGARLHPRRHPRAAARARLPVARPPTRAHRRRRRGTRRREDPRLALVDPGTAGARHGGGVAAGPRGTAGGPADEPLSRPRRRAP